MNIENQIILEQCEVKCPRCGKNWVTSLLVDWCHCLNCETKLDPKKHLVIESENEVN